MILETGRQHRWISSSFGWNVSALSPSNRWQQPLIARVERRATQVLAGLRARCGPVVDGARPLLEEPAVAGSSDGDDLGDDRLRDLLRTFGAEVQARRAVDARAVLVGDGDAFVARAPSAVARCARRDPACRCRRPASPGTSAGTPCPAGSCGSSRPRTSVRRSGAIFARQLGRLDVDEPAPRPGSARRSGTRYGRPRRSRSSRGPAAAFTSGMASWPAPQISRRSGGSSTSTNARTSPGSVRISERSAARSSLRRAPRLRHPRTLIPRNRQARHRSGLTTIRAPGSTPSSRRTRGP